MKPSLTLPRQPSNAEKLNLYALYKQASVGDNRTAKPGLFDPIGAAKWRAWSSLKGTPLDVAKQRYIDLVAQLQQASGSASRASLDVPGLRKGINIDAGPLPVYSNWPTLDACLHERATELPNREVFAFLDIDGKKTDSLSYGELDLRARRIAGVLQAQGGAGKRALLLLTCPLQTGPVGV
ncbi:acyl-CoA-binding protein [Burkholderia pyrrocinia]